MGMSAFKMTARGDRPEWSEVKDRIDLAAVATSLLGPAPGRRGERGRRLWWPCPFHDDHNPSLAVDPGRKSWRCFGCGENGDAAALVMKLNQCTFPEAVRWLAEQVGVVPTSSRPRPPSGGPKRPRPPAASQPAKAPEKPARQSSGLPLADALKLVEDAAKGIWTPEGADALAYLRGRGLTEATIRAARLGWTPRAAAVPWKPPGVVMPWFDAAGRLALLKIRPPDEWGGRFPKERMPPKYIQHIAEHGVTVDEVEEVLHDPRSRVGRSRRSGRPQTFGWTSTGKFITVIWEEVADDPRMIYPVTAYEVPPPQGRQK
jgi:hypothetical protein